jgi:arylsulfatase B
MNNPARRTFLKSLAATAALAAARPPAEAAPASPANVIFLLTDDQGYGDLACHGNPSIKTPNLDALHARSVRFTNFHVSPTCAPTRSAFMTGRYSNATGAWHTIMGRSLLGHDEVTMASCFRAAGFRTGIFGKWHLGDNYPCRPNDKGFDEAVVCGGGGVWQTPDYFGNDYTDDSYFHNGKPEAYKGYCTDVWFENAIAFMDAAHKQGRRFFCYIPTNAPHGPMWAPDSYSAAYAGVKKLVDPGFYGMITNIDDNLAKLVNFLRDRGLENDTLFVYGTDNGTSSGERVFNAGMRAKKGSPYEGGHRVPLFLHWPKGGLEGGRDIGALAAHIDLLPTMIDVCRLKRPGGLPMHGRSLSPLLFEKNPSWPDRTLVTDSQRLEKLVKWRQAAVMTDQWRLVNPSPDGDPSRLELYDIRKDPGQKQNVAAQNPQVVERLKAGYEKWWIETSKRANEYVRIVLGNAKAGPVRLTCHDWHGDGAEKVWNQRGIRLGPEANGFWAVYVEKAGEYRVELRRWGGEVDLPINAPYRDSRPNREDAQGKAISAVKARLKIGAVDETRPVDAADKAAVFKVRLEKGPAELRTWFYGGDNSERGAYYVYVENAG